MGCCMVAKCANPSCSRSFRYLGEGRLFRLEADPAFSLSDNPTFGSSKIVEYFWLCDACSTSMTLRLDEKGTVTAEPLSEPAPANPRDFAIISRHKCMLLRTVSTTRAGITGRPAGQWPGGTRRSSPTAAE
jgi:hypothetical protein